MDRDEIALRVRDGLETVQPHPLDHRVIVARAGRRRRLRGAIGAALALVAGAALAISLLGGPSEGPLSPPTVQASAQVALPGRVVGTAAAEGEYLWVLTCSTKCGGPPSERHTAKGALVKIDNRTGAILATTAVDDPGVVAVGEGGVWTAGLSGVVTRFDPRTGRPTDSLRLSLPRPVTTTAPEAFAFLANGITAGGGAVWVSTAREYVAQIDPKTAQVLRMIRTPFMVSGMTASSDFVWLSAGLFGLARIDTASGDLEPAQPIEDGEGRRLSVDYLTLADGSLWARGGWAAPHGRGDYVLSPRGKALGLARVDRHTAEVEQLVSFDGWIWVHAVSGPHLWLSSRDSNAGSKNVYVLSREAGKVSLAARLARPGTIVGAVGTSLWVARPGEVLERYEIPVPDGL